MFGFCAGDHPRHRALIAGDGRNTRPGRTGYKPPCSPQKAIFDPLGKIVR